MEQPIKQMLKYPPCPSKTQLRGLGGDQPSEVTESWTNCIIPYLSSLSAFLLDFLLRV